MTEYNVYCDESCHQLNDHHQVMVLGAVYCPTSSVPALNEKLRQIKQEHGLARDFEIKWVKVSPAKLEFYIAVLEFYFSTTELRFRSVVIPDKSKLNHEKFGQSHDEWYHKMYFTLLKALISSDNNYYIYLDIKDTWSSQRFAHLHDVLCSNIYDFSHSVIPRVQSVRSHEVNLLQVTDLLIGAVSYINRGLQGSSAKMAIIKRFQELSGLSLTNSTSLSANKVNIFQWTGWKD